MNEFEGYLMAGLFVAIVIALFAATQVWDKHKPIKQDPFCSKCGCPMTEMWSPDVRDVLTQTRWFNPKTGGGLEYQRLSWECSRFGDDGRHDFVWLHNTRTIPIKSQCDG